MFDFEPVRRNIDDNMLKAAQLPSHLLIPEEWGCKTEMIGGYDALHKLAFQISDVSMSRYQLVFKANSSNGEGQLINCHKEIVLYWETVEKGIEKLRKALSDINHKFELGKAQILKKVQEHGGAIVSSNECSQLEIDDARATDRFFVDEDGFGYVWRTQDYLDSRETAFRYWAKNSPKEDVKALRDRLFFGKRDSNLFNKEENDYHRG